jgi:5-hydroxyisourate hydrolase-like protein (transthyretin family)
VLSRPLPAAGVVVNVQAYVPGRGWVVFASPRTDSNGRFAAHYRFRNTTTTTRYRLRAVTRMDSGAPFLTSISRRAAVTVAG